MGLTVAILAYHEADNLKWLLPNLKKIIDSIGIDKVEYLIVDSTEPTDDTEDVCRQFGAIYMNQEEPGYGGACRMAIRQAREEYFMVLDADGSQDYTQFPKMYEMMMTGADLVIGSRYIPGGKTDDVKSSQFMSRFLNFCFRPILGVEAHDLSGSFRIYRTDDLRKLHLTGENFETFEEIILKLKLTKGGKINIKEVPISFVKRKIGKSKRSLAKFIVCLGRMLIYSIILRLIARNGYNPLYHDKKAEKITELFLYGGVGVLTTLINLLSYFWLSKVMYYLTANILAWVIAVIFAFITNKTIAFNSWSWEGTVLKREFTGFIGSRIATGILDMLMLWFMVDVISIHEPFPKILDAVIVIILNFVLSKTVFRKDKN